MMGERMDARRETEVKYGFWVGALHRAGEIRGDQERNGVKGAAESVLMGLGGW